MRTQEEWSAWVTELQSDNGKMAGKMGAMARYMDAIGIPAMPKIHKRVKMMTILYQQMQIENKRLTLLLNDMGEDDA